MTITACCGASSSPLITSPPLMCFCLRLYLVFLLRQSKSVNQSQGELIIVALGWIRLFWWNGVRVFNDMSAQRASPPPTNSLASIHELIWTKLPITPQINFINFCQPGNSNRLIQFSIHHLYLVE